MHACFLFKWNCTWIKIVTTSFPSCKMYSQIWHVFLVVKCFLGNMLYIWQCMAAPVLICNECINARTKKLGKTETCILSALPFICGVIIMSIAVFLLHFHHIYWVGLPAYLSNHSLFWREHIFVGCNEFPALICHPSSPATWAYSFSKSEMGFYVFAL